MGAKAPQPAPPGPGPLGDPTNAHPNIVVGQKALVTLDNWFYAPDGKTYRAVFGTVKAVRTSEESLGVKTNARSTNWYLEIGRVTVAGCQIHYVVRCDEVNTGRVEEYQTNPEKGILEYSRPTTIYLAD